MGRDLAAEALDGSPRLHDFGRVDADQADSLSAPVLELDVDGVAIDNARDRAGVEACWALARVDVTAAAQTTAKKSLGVTAPRITLSTGRGE